MQGYCYREADYELRSRQMSLAVIYGTGTEAYLDKLPHHMAIGGSSPPAHVHWSGLELTLV